MNRTEAYAFYRETLKEIEKAGVKKNEQSDRNAKAEGRL